MALATYSDLKTAIADWANRTDLTAKLDDFILMAESRMYDEMVLKDMESEEALTLTLAQNYVAIPTGYISPITFWLIVSTQRVELQFVLPQDLPYYTDNSIPRYWAIDGVNIRFDCPANSGYSAKFRMLKKSNLSGSNTTNYLLTRRPDVYLAACLVEVARYVNDDELFNMWEPRYQKGAAGLKAADARGRDVGLRSDLPMIAPRPSIFRGE